MTGGELVSRLLALEASGHPAGKAQRRAADALASALDRLDAVGAGVGSRAASRDALRTLRRAKQVLFRTTGQLAD